MAELRQRVSVRGGGIVLAGAGGAISFFCDHPHPAIGTLGIDASVITGNVADADLDGNGAGGGLSVAASVPLPR